MALFKIFNNIDSNNNLPATYNKGYCYFDATTNKFYIDTDGSGTTTGTRVPLNSKFSDVATTGLMLPYTVCNTAASLRFKEITIATEGWTKQVGSMIAVYFAHENSAENPELIINGEEDSVPIYKCFGKAAGNTSVESWDAGSIIIFFYTEGTGGSNPGWIMANWNLPSDSYGSSTQPIYWNAGVPTAITSYNGNAATATGANLTTTQNALTYYSDTSGTFADSEIIIIPSSKHIGGLINGGQKSGTTLGDYATAEGYRTTSSKIASHAEGYRTTSSEIASHAEGNATTASRMAAHAEGNFTTASGKYSHVEGNNTTAQRQSQHVFGEYNILDTTGEDGTVRGQYVEIVGNGTSDTARSNARTLDWDGNERLAGGLLPMASNSQTLGTTTYRWKNVYIGTADAYGDAYTPVYWNDGVPTAVSIVQKVPFTINSGKKGVILTHASFTVNSYVIQIIITSGESNLGAGITWTSAGTGSTAGTITLNTTVAVDGNVSGYILVIRGSDISDATSADVS